MTQAIMWSAQRRYEIGDCSRNLFEIVQDFDDEILRIPEFQREFVWPENKRRQFVKRFLDGRKPIGVIATYELEGDPDKIVYLNDGVQRLSTLRQLLHEPAFYGLSKEEAQSLLRSFNFSVQHRSYANHDEAAQDFKDINQGTFLTALEFFRGDLTNIKNYKSVWGPRIDRLHKSVELSAATICSKPQAERSVAHRYHRHDFSLFYRFASGDTTIGSHGVNAKQASMRERDKGNYIEAKFRQWIETHGVESFDVKFRNLMSIIEMDTAVIESEYRQVQPDFGRRLGVVLYRWLLDVSVWRRNNKLDTEQWKDFVRRYMQHTGGTQTFPESQKKHAVIIMGDLSRLKQVCRFIGSSLYEGEQPKRARRPSDIQAGYDVSHIIPFSLHGDGPTVVEPASLNRARGAKPIELIGE